MASLTKLQSAKQFTMQGLAVVEDKSKIMFATVNRSATKELDIAIVKSTTSQFHVIPKEKHVRTLKNSAHPAKPRREVQYMILELLRRLYTASDWVTALKTLIVVHRLMRETDVTFIEEMLKVSEDTVPAAERAKAVSDESGNTKTAKGQVLRVDNFLDTTTIDGRFDFSEWVRAYGKYLDEQLDVYNQINFYVEQVEMGGESRMRALSAKDLLFQLPKLQKLLQRLVDCIPKGAAAKDAIVQEALLYAVKESFKLYKSISEGIFNLADVFFEMEYLDAQKGLDIYRHFIAETESLQAYYQHVEGLEDLKSRAQFPSNFTLETPSPDFVQLMENYVREAQKGITEGGPTKTSPPLRRGTKSKSFRSGGLSSSVSSVRSDPGMVMMPVGHAGATIQEVPSPKEVDLLALDMDDTLVVSAPQDNGTADVRAAMFEELSGGTNSSADPFATAAPPAAAPQPQYQQAPQPQYQQTPVDPFASSQSFTSNPTHSFTSNANQSFTSDPNNSFTGQANSNPFAQTAAPPPQMPLSNGVRPPPLVPSVFQGSDPGQFSPQVSQFSPQMSAASPQVSGFAPQPSQFSPTVSNHMSGVAPTPRGGQSQVPPSPSGSFTSFGVPPSNLRQSALLDPFAEFNAVKKPEPKEVKDTSPPMRPTNTSFSSATFSPMASPAPSFSGTNNSFGQVPAARMPSNHLSPTASFSSAPSQAAWLGNSFTNSFSNSFPSGPAPQPVAAGAHAFPTTFDDNKSNSLI